MRPELTELSHQKINLKSIEDSLTATGVDIERADGTLQTIHLSSKGHVVLTAGAINTPKVLMLSGLGHGDDLNKLGLPVQKHLPRVGMNLQDHPVLAMTYESPEAGALDIGRELNRYFLATQNDATNATSFGMMGSAGISAGAFLIPPGATLPEIQLTFFPRKSEPHVSNSSELTHDPQILITVALLHPSARNRIVLTTKDDRKYTPRIMSEVPDQEAEHLRTDDVRKLAWGVSVVREVTNALGTCLKHGYSLKLRTDISHISPQHGEAPSVKRSHPVRPSPLWMVHTAPHLVDLSFLEFSTPFAVSVDILQWVPTAVFRNSHWVGSAAMGNSSDTAVVDSRLRVFGVRKLRVADASVIPTIPNGNVHSSVLMVASHAAELIRADEEAAEGSEKLF
jgi:choline dehydrogenase